MRVLLFGAGQFGTVLYRLLDAQKYEVLGFVDNNKAGGVHEGLPVYAVSAIAALKPDAVMLAVQGTDRREAMCRQLAGTGVHIEFPLIDGLDLRMAQVFCLAEAISRRGVPGAAAELGVYKGDSAAVLNKLFKGRPLYLFDTFSGFAPADIKAEQAAGGSCAKAGDFCDTNAAAVLSRMPFPKTVLIREGWFPQTSRSLESVTFCFVSLDADLFEPIAAD